MIIIKNKITKKKEKFLDLNDFIKKINKKFKKYNVYGEVTICNDFFIDCINQPLVEELKYIEEENEKEKFLSLISDNKNRLKPYLGKVIFYKNLDYIYKLGSSEDEVLQNYCTKWHNEWFPFFARKKKFCIN